MNLFTHEPEDRLELYALGRLSHSDAAQVEEHLFVCEQCRESAEETHNYSLAMRGALIENPVGAKEPEKLPWLTWLWQPRFALGAALAMLALAVGLSLWSGNARTPALATLQLTAMRGDIPTVQSSRALDLTLLDPPAASTPLKVELVDGTGGEIWNGSSAVGTSQVHSVISRRLSPGDYFVRLRDGSGKLLREYGFRVR